MITITLAESEVAWTDANVGKKRQDNAVAQARMPGNNAPDDADLAMWMHVLGARCEAAAYKWAKPVKWNWAHLGRDKVPDLGEFIDVKGVNDPAHNLIVKPNDVGDWAYLLVDGSAHPDYDIVGWCWGHEAKGRPLEERKAGRPTHFVDRDSPLLKPPRTLLALLRGHNDHLCHCGDYGTVANMIGPVETWVWLCNAHALAKPIEQRDK